MPFPHLGTYVPVPKRVFGPTSIGPAAPSEFEHFSGLAPFFNELEGSHNMLKKTLIFLVVVVGVLMLSTYAMADGFTNGGFENGNLGGWSQGGGSWFGGWPLNPADYVGGTPNNMVVGSGIDPISGLKMVYNGSYAAKVNDSYNDYSVSLLSQTVNNYSAPAIYFAWQAVLQGSHGPTDSDNFTLQLRDDTKGINLYNVAYSSATAAGTTLFQGSANYYDWFFTPWQVENLDVSAYMGDSFTLSLLASDCPYGGHAGYVYLDGFGGEAPIDNNPVPEPGSLLLLGSGLALVAKRVWNRAKLPLLHFTR